jgi:hypothetical protein
LIHLNRAQFVDSKHEVHAQSLKPSHRELPIRSRCRVSVMITDRNGFKKNAQEFVVSLEHAQQEIAEKWTRI